MHVHVCMRESPRPSPHHPYVQCVLSSHVRLRYTSRPIASLTSWRDILCGALYAIHRLTGFRAVHIELSHVRLSCLIMRRMPSERPTCHHTALAHIFHVVGVWGGVLANPPPPPSTPPHPPSNPPPVSPPRRRSHRLPSSHMLSGEWGMLSMRTTARHPRVEY